MSKHNYFFRFLIKIDKFINSLLSRNLNKLNVANLKNILINNKVFLTIVLLVILFFSYLSLPNIFNKNQISVELKKNLLDKLNLEFNFEKKLDYKFLPRPHFITSESTLIFNENKISEKNKLKIYVSLESLFSLKNMKVKNIVSFEASPLNFKFLENNKKNLEKKFPNTKIIIENLALSSDGRVVSFKQFNESSSSTINNINQESKYFKRKFNLLNIQNKKKIYESFKLKTETLDNYMYQNNFNRISFLKIDTEGYEYEILIGLKKKIKSIDTIMFEHHYDNMIIKEYTFSDINYLLKKNDFYQVFKSRMPFRKSFEYIYRRNDID